MNCIIFNTKMIKFKFYEFYKKKQYLKDLEKKLKIYTVLLKNLNMVFTELFIFDFS